MSFVKNLVTTIDEALDSGDPHVREWFLIKSKFWPPFLTFMYLLFVKVIGPAYMKDRKPYDLRIVMIVYNFSIVAGYTFYTIKGIICLMGIDLSLLCVDVEYEEGTWIATMAWCCYLSYLVKYVEFLDTIFFVLRKKDHLITNLHVIHHSIIPPLAWVGLRMEKNGLAAFPVIINSIIHIVMYSYYGLAAIGPNVRKYLWWKKYLTITQMAQFVIDFLYATVWLPYSGCYSTKYGTSVGIGGTILFFALFCNYYKHTFKSKKND